MPKAGGGKLRDPIATKARILKEATAAFAKSGFNASSTDQIVAAAKVNKRMLYHYFGDKAGLYRAVLLAQWGGLQRWFLADTALQPEDAGQALETIVTLLCDYVAANPAFVRILMWEGLDGGRFSRSLWKDVRGPLFSQVANLIGRAQKEGALNARLDPAQFIVSFLGAITFYYAYASTLGDVFGKDPLSAGSLRKRKAHLLALLRAHGT